MEIGTLGWIVAAIAVAAVAIVVILAISRRGQADGSVSIGPLSLSVNGGTRASARIADAKSRQGAAAARAAGDASIERTEVQKDLTAEAGLPREAAPKD